MKRLISRGSYLLLLAFAVTAPLEAAEPRVASALESLGIHGGLCVQLGAKDTTLAGQLATSGQYLLQVLDPDEAVVEQARKRLQATGLYGLISVDQMPGEGKLPYTENLVNFVFVVPQPSIKVSLEELHRVLCPGGVLVIGGGRTNEEELAATGFSGMGKVDMGLEGLWVALKPRPREMDEWTHARHSAAGNPVSNDTQVAPPRRVRWIAGAESEVRGMVTASGRNFYAGVLARDSFNGLRLWHRDLAAPESEHFVMKNLRSAAPVAGDDRLFVVEGKKLIALDARSGEAVQEYPAAGKPKEVLFDRGTLIVTTNDSIRALYASSGDVRWQVSLSSPHEVVAGDNTVALLHGEARRNEPIKAVVIERETGQVRWKRGDLDWLPKVRRLVYDHGLVAFEVSTFNNDGPENVLHLLDAATGKVQLDHPFYPGMNHNRQARAMFVNGSLWLLHGGKDAEQKRLPVQVSMINTKTGEAMATHPAGLTHCFPPVMTTRYMIAGEFDLTDLATGEVDANHITKAACGPDGGWVPANGLVYVTPKHCVCWPMLRGFTALASERPAGSIADMKLDEIKFPLEKGVAPPDARAEDPAQDWPMYRHDGWRSGSTTAQAPDGFDTLWSADLGATVPEGIVTCDWEENLFVKGPITPPAIAAGRVVVARPDAHEVVALDAATGQVAWRFTASGRVDTTPTLHKGLCLFGSKAGWVYCLRADDGRLVWRLRAAPVEEQLVAYGQLESPWPVPGSVLIVDDVAYFAAGRQSLADGGILIFAVDPTTGQINWTRRLDSVPQTNFYDCSALEFDNFDLLHRQGDGVAMSRWVFDRKSGEMSLDRWAAFARLDTGGGAVMAPQGCWTYAPRHRARIKSYQPLRPLTVYRDKVLFGSLQGSSTVYRRDFDLEGGEKFDTHWMTGWSASTLSRKGEMPWRSHRLAEKAAWKADPLGAGKDAPPIHAMVLAKDRLLLVGGNGDLRAISTGDGSVQAKAKLPEPLWDGLALAQGRLFYSTRDGHVLCLGKK